MAFFNLTYHNDKTEASTTLITLETENCTISSWFENRMNEISQKQGKFVTFTEKDIKDIVSDIHTILDASFFNINVARAIFPNIDTGPIKEE